MNKRELLIDTYNSITQHIPESHRFRSAFEIYRCIAFFQAAVQVRDENPQLVLDAFANTSRALVHVAELLNQERKDVYMERIARKLGVITEKNGAHTSTLQKLQKLCQQVIRFLGVSEDELRDEYSMYQQERQNAQQYLLATISDFLFKKKVLEHSKFDSAKKALLHRFVERYGEDRMLQTGIYRDYLEYRDTNKLRINTATVALGSLEELVLLSDQPSSVVEPLIADIRKHKKEIAETVSVSHDQDEVDTETFDVEEYLSKRFTKEYEDGHTRPNMDPHTIEEIDSLCLRVIWAIFPDTKDCSEIELQERVQSYISGSTSIPHSELSVPHIYAEEDGST